MSLSVILLAGALVGFLMMIAEFLTDRRNGHLDRAKAIDYGVYCVIYLATIAMFTYDWIKDMNNLLG